MLPFMINWYCPYFTDKESKQSYHIKCKKMKNSRISKCVFIQVHISNKISRKNSFTVIRDNQLSLAIAQVLH